MILTSEKKRLLFLYYAGSVTETVTVIRSALNDITDTDDRAAANGLLRKLEVMSETAFTGYDPEGGCTHA